MWRNDAHEVFRAGSQARRRIPDPFPLSGSVLTCGDGMAANGLLRIEAAS